MQRNDYQQYFVQIHFRGCFTHFKPFLKGNVDHLINSDYLWLFGHICDAAPLIDVSVMHFTCSCREEWCIFTKTDLMVSSLNGWHFPLMFTNRKALERNRSSTQYSENQQRQFNLFREKIKIKTRVCIWQWEAWRHTTVCEAEAGFTLMAHINNHIHSELTPC